MVVKSRTIIFSQPGALPEAGVRDLITQVIAFEVPPRVRPKRKKKPRVISAGARSD